MPRAATAVLALLLALGTGLVVGSASASAPPTSMRALWVWSRPAPDDLVAFAQERGVSELIVAVPPAVSSSGDLPRLRRLAELSRDANIRLVALAGEPEWTTDHGAALSWQRAALDTGLFAGAHVDVEPHQLPGWATRRRQLVSSYAALLAKLQDASALPLEAAVPFWYGEVPAARGTLADAVLREVDAVTAMSYRDTATGPNGMLGVGADLLARGGAAGKPVRLGAETNPLPGDSHATFAEEGATVMNVVLDEVDREAASYASYAGIAVHDYDGWRALRP